MPIDIDQLTYEELIALNHRIVERVKSNRKTITAITDDVQRWNVSPHLLSLGNDVEPETSPKSSARPRLK